MAAVFSVSLWWIFTSSFLLVSAAEASDMNITVKAGENVVLPCQAPRNIHVSAVEWIRPDLQPEYVYMHRQERYEPENQHQSFKNRVDLKHKNMKDGDVSVILMNVVPEDNGTYECHVYKEEITRKKRSNSDTKYRTINLKVRESGGGAGHTGDGGDKEGGDKDGGDMGGHVVLPVVLSVVAVAVVVVVVGFVIFRKRGKKLNSNQGPADEEDVEEPLQYVT